MGQVSVNPIPENIDDEDDGKPRLYTSEERLLSLIGLNAKVIIEVLKNLLLNLKNIPEDIRDDYRSEINELIRVFREKDGDPS